MLLRHRPPVVDATPVTLQPGLEHLDQAWVAVLRWLNANKVDYVLVGPAAHAIRGELTAQGALAVVPAPYSRNYERLTRGLVAQNATLRSSRAPGGAGVEIELTSDKLARGRRWLLRFAGYDLDVENAARRAGSPAEEAVSDAGEGSDGVRYQELLYEAVRFELAPGLSVEVAAPEDLELLAHLGRTGAAPEFRVSRSGQADPAATGRPGDQVDS